MAWEYVVLHHSLTPDGQTVSWGAIRTYHVKTNGWTDVGYHFGVELVGTHYEILIGRTLSEDGAHCKEAGMNRRGIGVCLVGNFDLASPPDGQLRAAARIVTWAMKEFQVPRERVIGHRDAGLLAGFDWTKGQYKTCPGVQFSLDVFREMLPPFL